MDSVLFRVEIECVFTWGDYAWVWRVYDELGDLAWDGTTHAKWTAKRAAKRAANKLRKGQRPEEPTGGATVLWL